MLLFVLLCLAYFDLEVLYFYIFLELAILDGFSKICMKHAMIPIFVYYNRNI